MRILLLPALLCGLCASYASFAQQTEQTQQTVLIIERQSDPLVRQWITSAIPEAKEFVQKTFSISVSQKVVVYASSDAVWLSDRYLEARNLPESHRPGKLQSFGVCDPPAEFGGYFIFLCLKSSVWSEGEITVKGIVAHEYWHIVQTDLVGEKALGCCTNSTVMSVYGPEWLKEGSAQFVRYMVLDALHLDDAERTFSLLAHTIPPGNLQLTERNTRGGYQRLNSNVSLRIGILAARLLVQQSGYAALVHFYRLLGEDKSSEEAFAAAFGRTEEAFEDELALFIAELRSGH